MKKGLYANIHAKRERIAEGSGEKMRRVGSKGAPTAEAFKQSARTAKMSEGGETVYFKGPQRAVDKLRYRTFQNSLHRMPRKYQTDMREINRMNIPNAPEEYWDTPRSKEIMQEEKDRRPKVIKNQIKMALGTHGKSNLPKKSGGKVKKSNSCW
jgi:hypothetical protein